MRALILVLFLAGCATTRQCSIGVMFFGPLPVPTAGCELIFEPKADGV